MMSIQHRVVCTCCGRRQTEVTTADSPTPFAEWLRVPGADLCPSCAESKIVIQPIAPIARGTA